MWFTRPSSIRVSHLSPLLCSIRLGPVYLSLIEYFGWTNYAYEHPPSRDLVDPCGCQLLERWVTLGGSYIHVGLTNESQFDKGTRVGRVEWEVVATSLQDSGPRL